MNLLDGSTPLEAQNAPLASAQALVSIANSLSRICQLMDEQAALAAHPMVYGADYAKPGSASEFIVHRDGPSAFDPAIKETKVVNDALMGMPGSIDNPNDR